MPALRGLIDASLFWQDVTRQQAYPLQGICFSQRVSFLNQQTRELISALYKLHKYNNKDLSRLR